MRARVALQVVLVVSVISGLQALSAQERWVYRYDGSAGDSDCARSIAIGPDSNLYVAGFSTGVPTSLDFAVLSLTPSGVERWVYLYDEFNLPDAASSIVVGSDGNLYASGYVGRWAVECGFAVISLSSLGVERWVYRYDGPGDGWADASSMTLGVDGNLYAAGFSPGIGTGYDFTVVSLTDSGEERWVYRYDGPADGDDRAASIAAGVDGNLYVAGYSADSSTGYDFTVVSLSDSGVERWVYRYDGPGNGDDEALSIAMGSDGNVYAAGYCHGGFTGYDFAVVSLTDSGTERWLYRYNGPGAFYDGAYSVIMGPDGNVYATGFLTENGISSDVAVLSLTDAGEECWVYRYDGPENDDDVAVSIAADSDGYFYAAGSSIGVGTSQDFTVVSLTDSGTERWVYRNDPPSAWDEALSIVGGSDGILYAAGQSDWDLTVVSLSPDVGIKEMARSREISFNPEMSVSPIPSHSDVKICFLLPRSAEVQLSVYDVSGKLVADLLDGRVEAGLRTVFWNRRHSRDGRIVSGTYFARLQGPGFCVSRKLLLL